MTGLGLEGFELSPQQRRLWSLLQDELPSPYQAGAVVRIDGKLDIAALRGALADLSALYEALRTTYRSLPGMRFPLQVVSGEARLELEVVDLAPSTDLSRAIDSFFESVERRTPDVASGPLFSLRLLSRSLDQHLLLIQAPALATDASGLEALLEAIAQGYASRLRGEALSEEPLQYVDAATWLNQVVDAAETEMGREFWRKQAASSMLRLRLPFESPERGRGGFAPRFIPVEVEPGSFDAIESGGRAHGISPEALLLTCWQSLLGRLLGETRIIVALGSDGRSYEELRKSVGLFARTLPLSGELSFDLPLRDASMMAAEAMREAQKWGECFVWESGSENGGSGRVPFLPFSFQHRELPRPIQTGGVTFTVERLEDCTDRFKLKLLSETGDEGWTLRLGYDRTFYEDDDARRLAAQIAMLVRDATRHPEAKLGELRLLSDTERRELASIGDNPGRPARECVHRLFEAQARRSPDAVAVVDSDQKLTYAELNDRADRLARALYRHGVGPEIRVALAQERSIDSIVGILGVLKAGGAYVPLDLRLPKSRMAKMLEASGTSVVVTHHRLMPELFADSYRVVAIDEPTSRGTDGVLAIEHPANPDSLAYVLFTSGSTGGPKAVAVEHRQIVNYVEAIGVSLELQQCVSYATVTTLAADLGNTAIYPALCGGGCLYVVSEAVGSDPEALGDYMQRYAIDVLKIVPSHLEALLSCSRPERILPRKRLVLGGERCTWELVDKVRALAPHCMVFNHYGPTETTIGVTTQRLAPSEESRAASPPIGRPIAGVRAYVLDSGGEPVPPWFPGELHIGGAAVARGYLNDQKLTERKFVRDRFSNEPGARLYRSGDRVRWLPGGAIEFLGRIDDQVKIRGFRVEPGEIEAAARRIPEIREAAVVVRTDDSGEKRLVVYLVPADGRIPDASEVAGLLRGELPDYMVPASLVFLDALPLTPNGKLDRDGLPDPAQAPHRDDAEGPATEWESMIAEIWGNLLHSEEVSVHDNFYDLGGHSLLAIQVVSAVEKRTGIQVSPREMIFHTLRQFAAVCESRMSGREQGALGTAK